VRLCRFQSRLTVSIIEAKMKRKPAKRLPDDNRNKSIRALITVEFKKYFCLP